MARGERFTPPSLCHVRRGPAKLYTARKRSPAGSDPWLVAVRRGIQISDRTTQCAPFLTSDPNWTQQELEDSGAVFTAQQVFEIVAALRSNQAELVTRQGIDGIMTKSATEQMKEWVVQCTLKMPRHLAGTLAYNHWHMDWRDLIPRINLPTLIISGRASAAAPWKSQKWIHRQIKGSQLEVFEEAEGGQHFMFIENPEKFNRMIMKYLG